MKNVRSSIPILRSFYEAKAREFYLEFLGFDVVFEHRFEPGTPLYMGIALGDCELHISEHHGDACPGSALRIEVDDVDVYCKTLVQKRYKYARPDVQQQAWGFREMTIRDAAGNRLVFCTPVSQ